MLYKYYICNKNLIKKCDKEENVAGQHEVETQYCHSRIKIGMISSVLCDNYFCKN